MEEKTDILGLLDLMTRPGFCVKDERIVKVNSATQARMLEVGTPITDLLQTGAEEYCQLTDGCLCLTLNLAGMAVNATVTTMDNYRIFVLDQDTDDAVFNAMALVSRELRKPLDSVMSLADQLLSKEDQSEESRQQAAHLNRGLYQILRIVGNLAYPASAGYGPMEVRNIGAIVDEILEKTQTLLAEKNIALTYEGLSKSVYCLVDAVLLERAILNLISNAVKFSPEGSPIRVSFSLRGRTLQLQVQDSGTGIAQQVKNDLFYRYLRQPGIEDGRFGMGLGMVLIRSCATRHGGVVLVDEPHSGGSRITLTLAIRQASGDRLHSPMNLWVDYTGGRDHALVELSDCLTTQHYDTTK